MRSIDEVRNEFGFHPATAETGPMHDAVRALFAETAEKLWVLLPDGPAKTVAFRNLQASQMYANLSVALLGPTAGQRDGLTPLPPESMVE